MYRFATFITLYKKDHNAVVSSIINADNNDHAMIKAIGSESVCEYLAENYRIFWKVCIEVPELNSETGKYQLKSEQPKIIAPDH